MCKLSIIIPVYNADKYLRKCVESILEQTYRDFEILLIDDGSKDASPQLCDEFAGEDSRINVIHKPNGGCSSARNRGIQEASGEYIAFVDADDVLDVEFYEILVSVLEKYNVDISACSFIHEYKCEIIPKKKQKWVKPILFKSKREVLVSITAKEKSIEGYVWNKVWRKTALQGQFFSDEVAIVDDAFFTWNAVVANVNSAVYIDLPMYRYRIIQTSISRNSATNKYFKALLAYERMIESAQTLMIEECKQGLCEEYLVWNMAACERLLYSEQPNMNQYMKIQRNVKKYIKYVDGLRFKDKVRVKAISKSWFQYKLIGNSCFRLKKAKGAIESKILRGIKL